MTPPALDHTSRRILRLLAADGRASYQAIADEIGLSRPAVMERVKRLEEAGFIRGYHARLDRAKSGFPITAFVADPLPGHRQRGRRARIQALADNPHVLECHHVAGDDCYMLKVAAPSIESLEGVLRRDQAAGPAGQHPDDDRALHRLREAGHRPGGGRLMAGLRGRALIAYLLVCTVWGSTYLAIRIGVMHLPPLLFAGVRFLIAGVLLAGVVLATGGPLPRDPARLGGARDRRPLPAAGRQRGGGLGRAVRRVGRGERVRGRGAALGGVLRRDVARRHDGLHLAGGRRARARLPRERAPRRRDAGRPAQRRPQRADRPHPRERVVGAGHGLFQAQPDRRPRPTPRRRCRCWPAGGDHACWASPWARPAEWRWSGAGPRRAGVPHRVRLDRRLHRLRLRAAPRLGHDRGDLRLREPGGRGAARLARPARADDRPHHRARWR